MKAQERDELLRVLQARFEKNVHRHEGVAWTGVRARLVRSPEALESLRALGGALFCDRRYGRVFVYHNGAQSYYAARGFRGSLAM